MSRMATKTKVVLTLSTKEVANSVKSCQFSKHYTDKVLRISVLNIMYRRISIDDSEFEQKRHEEIPYVIPKRKSTDKLIRQFHGISHGIVDAVNKEYLRELWVFIQSKDTEEMLEKYVFYLKYKPEAKTAKSTVTSDEIRDQTVDLMESLAALPKKKFDRDEIYVNVELKYMDGIPRDYVAPYFEDAPSPFCLSLDKKHRVVLGFTNTGYHRIKCIGIGKMLTQEQTNKSDLDKPSAIGSALLIESEDYLSDDPAYQEPAEKKGKKQKINERELHVRYDEGKKQKMNESEPHVRYDEGLETFSIASGSIMMSCCCEWELPSTEFEIVKCSKCGCTVHVVCYGYLSKDIIDEERFECHSCSGQKSDSFDAKMRAILFFIKKNRKIPDMILKNAMKIERQKLITTLMRVKVLSNHLGANNKSAINEDAVNAEIASRFLGTESQFFE